MATTIDPDQFLDLSRTAPFSREEGLAAWEAAYAALDQRLSVLGERAQLFVVFGVQAGGKSTWVRHRIPSASDHTVFFSGPLPSRRHRHRVLAIAGRYCCSVTAVWVKVPLGLALERNAQRKGLARVPESIIAHVYSNLEPATLDEGFHEVIVVDGADKM
ncbi:hypothetical protein [Propionivibrio soli]|jgi:hypothetical protein|uniref:hypothetical protein n=1 Tax=Propionivibrio soli TaxID=2976531 RepID=UPI0021E8A930|nr:hypothetical protein [Propionivibrio soli]